MTGIAHSKISLSLMAMLLPATLLISCANDNRPSLSSSSTSNQTASGQSSNDGKSVAIDPYGPNAADNKTTEKTSGDAVVSNAPAPTPAVVTPTPAVIAPAPLTNNGIGSIPLINMKLTGPTISECNGQGKAWLLQTSILGSAGACGENLATFTCTPAEARKVFVAGGQTALFDTFIGQHATYTLFNCGDLIGQLVLHWLDGSSTQVTQYETLTISLP